MFTGLCEYSSIVISLHIATGVTFEQGFTRLPCLHLYRFSVHLCDEIMNVHVVCVVVSTH